MKQLIEMLNWIRRKNQLTEMSNWKKEKTTYIAEMSMILVYDEF